jgi:LmbE family N-acetylglucosaminyl deacetylase
VNETAADGAVVFFHAHPDDEAIFTGGTIARCSAAGRRTVLVVATSGDLGHGGRGSTDLARRREDETRDAASILGIERVEFLRYLDSGVSGDPRNGEPGRFSTIDAYEAAARVAALLREERPIALVTYDRRGIYGHPDHIKVHEVGRLAADALGVGTVYEATVDHEYLHFVGPHLVERARGGRSRDLGLGVPSVAVTTTLTVGDEFVAKRAAMRAHRSQIAGVKIQPEVYGVEWYLRRGAAGVLDAIAA